jgi:hypothetical protein
VTGSACADPAGVAMPAPASVIGCYALRLGTWSAPRDSPDPPPVVALLDSTGSYLLEKGKSLVRPHPLGSPMPFDMAFWTRLSPEHLDLVFTDGGYVGVRLHLVWGWGDAHWRGTAEAFTDVRPSIQATATSTLSPRECS